MSINKRFGPRFFSRVIEGNIVLLTTFTTVEEGRAGKSIAGVMNEATVEYITDFVSNVQELLVRCDGDVQKKMFLLVDDIANRLLPFYDADRIMLEWRNKTYPLMNWKARSKTASVPESNIAAPPVSVAKRQKKSAPVVVVVTRKRKKKAAPAPVVVVDVDADQDPENKDVRLYEKDEDHRNGDDDGQEHGDCPSDGDSFVVPDEVIAEDTMWMECDDDDDDDDPSESSSWSQEQEDLLDPKEQTNMMDGLDQRRWISEGRYSPQHYAHHSDKEADKEADDVGEEKKEVPKDLDAFQAFMRKCKKQRGKDWRPTCLADLTQLRTPWFESHYGAALEGVRNGMGNKAQTLVHQRCDIILNRILSRAGDVSANRVPCLPKGKCCFCNETRDLCFEVTTGVDRWAAGSKCVKGVSAFIAWCKGLSEAFETVGVDKLEPAYRKMELAAKKMHIAHAAKSTSKR